MPEIFLETPRLILRDWQEADYEPYILLNMDSEVMEFFPYTLTREQSLSHLSGIRAHFDEYGYGLFALERKDNGRFIGFTGLSHPNFVSYFTPCVEVGWRLSKADWNNGFATEAAMACLQYGLNELQLPVIYSFTSIHNTRSEQVMKKIGLIRQGIFDHPSMVEGHFLRQHVLYKTNPENYI